MKKKLDSMMLVALSFVLLLFMPAAKASGRSTESQPPTADSMSIWQARRAISAALRRVWVYGLHLTSIDSKSLHFNPETIELDAFTKKGGKRHFTIDLKALGPLFDHCHSDYCVLSDARGKSLKPGKTQEPLARLEWGWDSDASPVEGVHAARSFVAGINCLRLFANDPEAPLRKFADRAAAWRALATKPPLPDKARLQRLLAEDALKHRQPQAALNYYERGLGIYPTWPQGWFNAALVAGQLGYYSDAVEHMQNYLKLVPNAKDAQSARDQIEIWQYKAKHSSTD